jgi:hypothetical protein
LLKDYHQGDIATLEENRTLILSAFERNRGKLDQITVALDRIHTGNKPLREKDPSDFLYHDLSRLDVFGKFAERPVGFLLSRCEKTGYV